MYNQTNSEEQELLKSRTRQQVLIDEALAQLEAFVGITDGSSKIDRIEVRNKRKVIKFINTDVEFVIEEVKRTSSNTLYLQLKVLYKGDVIASSENSYEAVKYRIENINVEINRREKMLELPAMQSKQAKVLNYLKEDEKK